MQASPAPIAPKRSGYFALALAAGVLLLSFAAGAQTTPVAPNTLPSGSTVQAGTVTITKPQPNKLQITQGSDKAIIDWKNYSIGNDAWVNYSMPGPGSVSLNRVTGGDPSQILGKLTANGTVMLINPNGILFGRNSVVDVAGLVATTANIRNDDFMAGRYSFTLPGKPGGTIVNEGSISIKQAGIAAFVAPGVENRGAIVADLGRISIGAANTFTLDLHGDGLIRVAVTDPVTTAALGEGQALVKNSGIIRANGGKVLITATAAKGVVDTLINMEGMVAAKSVSQSADGSITFDGGPNGTVRVAGTVDVSASQSGANAGKITITGEKVRIASTARIDATAVSGRGGTVKIGGDYQGKGETRQAKIVTVDAGALINASALDSGDGGTVVLWSTDITTFNGLIMAKGGQLSGNGGLVETSGTSNLFIGDTASVITLAPNGKTGTWLIDPTVLVVQAAAGNCTNQATCDAIAGAATISAANLVAALSANDVQLSASVSITFDAPVTWNAAGNSLTVNAPVVTFNAPVTGTGSATTNLIFSPAVTTVSLNAPISAQGGILHSNTITLVNVGHAGANSGSIPTALSILAAGGQLKVGAGFTYIIADLGTLSSGAQIVTCTTAVCTVSIGSVIGSLPIDTGGDDPFTHQILFRVSGAGDLIASTQIGNNTTIDTANLTLGGQATGTLLATAASSTFFTTTNYFMTAGALDPSKTYYLELAATGAGVKAPGASYAQQLSLRVQPPPPPGPGPALPVNLAATADAIIKLPWIDLNYIDPVRTSFYPATGGQYHFGTFASQFALSGEKDPITRGPLVPQNAAASPPPSTLGELAPGAGPDAAGPVPSAAQQLNSCAAGFMNNFWAWYTQCQSGPIAAPQ